MVLRFPGWSNRAYAAALVCALVAAGCSGDAPTGNALGPPARFDLVSGDNQTATVGTELPAPLVVKVLDANGRPIPNQVVNFVVTLGGGRAFAGAASTTTAGIAQERWTLGTVAGAQTIEVRSVDGATGQPRTWAIFSATATAGPAQSVVAVGGNDRSGVAGQPLVDSLVVKVIDQYGNGVANVSVAWSARSGSGSVSPATSTSNSAGVAKSRWTLAPTAGVDSASATAAGIPTSASFQATGTTGSPSVVAVVAGDNQTAPVTSVLPTRLAARVTDANGNPVSAVPVTWTVSASGGAVSSASASTDANGMASATWTLGQLAGAQTVTAMFGPAGSVVFRATVSAGPAAFVTKVSGDGQSGTVATTLPQPLVVRVIDAYGNGRAGETVTWITLRTAAASPTSAISDANGLARTTYTLSSTAGSQTVAARISNDSSVLFSETGLPGTNITLTRVNDLAVTGVDSAVTVGVVVRDGLGNPVPNLTVRWSVTSGGGVVSSASSSTDTSGTATTSWRLGAVTGTNGLNAAVGSVSAAFTATGLPLPAVSLTLISGDGQAGAAGQPLASDLVVRAWDRFGNAVPYALVTWSITSGGGATPVSSMAGPDGRASVRWTLGPGSGANTLQAGLPSLPSATPVGFSSTAATGATLPMQIYLVSGLGQGVAGCGKTCPGFSWYPLLPDSLVVRVTDAAGNGLPGVTVTWDAPQVFSGDTSASTSRTDATGRSAVAAKVANEIYQIFGIHASVAGGSSVTFTYQGRGTGAGTTGYVISGGGQTGRAGTELSQPVVALCEAVDGTPKSSCSFITSYGPGATYGTVRRVPVAYPPGQIAVYWTLGPQIGGQTLWVIAFNGPNSTTATATP
ncbi:MAG: Ig-like domain-containing protein [Gemmatimonadota bacterium]|nr:Ig-like domain-containing protein [Gemmatimonadota bacterium]